MEAISGIIKLAIASGTISFIVADASIFSFLRKWLEPRSTFLHKLFCCGFCFGTWVSFILEIIYQPNIFNHVVIIDQILTAFVIAFFSGLTWLTLNIFFDLAGK